MLKADLHIHTAEDPEDRGFTYDARGLIDRAAQLGFEVIAITNHRRVTYDRDLAAYAEARNILLIPGCEAYIEHKHLLIYNITEQQRASLHTFPDLRAFRRRHPHALVIAPHPTFWHTKSLTEERVVANQDCVDAIELSQYSYHFPNFNRSAMALGKRLDKPLVATSDAHSFRFFGKHYTMVDAKKDIASVLDAIRKGKVRPMSKHLSFRDGMYLLRIATWCKIKKMLGLPHDIAF
jgi:predicted metal-dependent phosphoesterase TrpH